MTKVKKKTKVLLITHAIAPYRIPLFNSMHQIEDFDFKVITLVERERNREWKIAKDKIKFNHQVLPGWHFFIWRERREIPIHINRKVIKTVWKYSPDVIITAGYDSLAYWLAFIYCKLFKRSFILWNESSLLSTYSIKGIRGILKRIIVRFADSYIAFGTKAKEYLEFLGTSSERISIGVNTDDLEFFRREVSKYQNNRNILVKRRKYPSILLLYIGQLIKRKGVIQILRALSILRDPEIGLLIIGSGREEGYLKAFCNDNNLKNIFFEGFHQHEELPKYYALADVFILASFNEVWGLVVNESLASGLYVLCSKYVGANYDLIKERWNGETFNPSNIEELSTIIKCTKEKIVSIRNRRDEISIHACKEFGLESPVNAFVKAIKSVQYKNNHTHNYIYQQ